MRSCLVLRCLEGEAVIWHGPLLAAGTWERVSRGNSSSMAVPPPPPLAYHARND